MPKYFLPSSWGKNSETIKFKTNPVNFNDGTKIKNSKLKKKTKKIKTNAKNSNKDLKEKTHINKTSLSKVKSGRVNKTKKLNNNKKDIPANLILNAMDTVEVSNQKPTGTAISSLEAKLKQELVGGRFRYINEQLYSMDSKKAEKLFRDDQEAFTAYHDGYRHQVEKWPFNPLERIIKMLRRLPKSLEIGDFGCGEGRLAKEIPHKVYSMDLVSSRDDIIACNMANTPLQSCSLDVAVFCLSLMGTNLNDYLIEANRVLKLHGTVYIVEIQSRFENVRDFVRGLLACGFELIKKDAAANFFYFFQFKKMRNVGKVAKIPNLTLNPCLYRKR